MQTINPHATLAELVREASERVQVFETLGVEYCCRGAMRLEDACATSGMDLTTVEALLCCEHDMPGGPPAPSPAAQCEEIEKGSHAYFRQNLPSLDRVVNAVYGQGYCSRHASRLRVAIGFLGAQISKQMDFEHTNLFPLVRSGWQAGEERLLSAIEAHDKYLAMTTTDVRRIRALTHEFTPPSRCNPHILTLYAALWDLDRHTRQYVHQLRNILIPLLRSQLALEGDRGDTARA